MAIFTDDRMAQLAYLDRSLDEKRLDTIKEASQLLNEKKLQEELYHMSNIGQSSFSGSVLKVPEMVTYPDYVPAPTISDIELLKNRISELERANYSMTDYVIGASKRFTALENLIARLQKELDEERNNRLRENKSWGAY